MVKSSLLLSDIVDGRVDVRNVGVDLVSHLWRSKQFRDARGTEDNF